MDTFKAFKYVSIIALTFLLIGNGVLFFLNNNEDEEASISEAQAQEMEELREQNERLSYLEETETLTAREESFDNLESQANRFLTSVFEQDAETYQTSKAEADEVMNDDLIDRFFSADMYGGNEVQTSIEDSSIYIENISENREEIDIVMDVDHKIEYLNTDMEEQSQAFVKVTFAKENDNWIATKFQDMS